MLSPRDLRIKGAFGKINSSRHSSRRHQGIPGAQETGIPPVGIAPHPELWGWKAELEPRVSILRELRPGRVMRFEQQHNNKPQKKRTEGSCEHRDCRDSRHSWLFLLSGTLVWDGSDSTKNLRGNHDAWEAHSPLWNSRGKAEPPAPKKPLSLGFLRPSSPIPAEELLLRAGSASQGSLPWEPFQGTLPGRCRCSLTALSTGSHRPLPGSHTGTGKPGSRGEWENLPVPFPGPEARHKPPWKQNSRAWICFSPSQRSPGAASAPGSARPSGSPDPRPPDSSTPSRPTPGAGSGTRGGGRGGSTSDV